MKICWQERRAASKPTERRAEILGLTASKKVSLLHFQPPALLEPSNTLTHLSHQPFHLKSSSRTSLVCISYGSNFQELTAIILHLTPFRPSSSPARSYLILFSPLHTASPPPPGPSRPACRPKAVPERCLTAPFTPESRSR